MRIATKDGKIVNVPIESETIMVEQVNYPTSQPFTTRTKLPSTGAIRSLQLVWLDQ